MNEDFYAVKAPCRKHRMRVSRAVNESTCEYICDRCGRVEVVENPVLSVTQSELEDAGCGEFVSRLWRNP